MKNRPHILIVDDEANVRKVLATLLEQSGYSTTCADSGEAALDLVRGGDPDLVPTVLALLDAKTSVPLAGTPIPTQAEAR